MRATSLVGFIFCLFVLFRQTQTGSCLHEHMVDLVVLYNLVITYIVIVQW